MIKMRLWTTVQLLLVVGLALHYSDACGAKGKRGKSGKKNDDPKPDNKKPSPDNNKPNTLGGVKQEIYDQSGYDGKSGQANSPDDLKCDFEGPCCWKNTKPPYDTMEWNKISGTIDPNVLKKRFNTDTAPSGKALSVASDKANGATDKAEFESCAICAGDSIKVTLKHWVTSGVKLQVCEVAKADPATLLNCQDVPASSPGPDTVTLPGGLDLILTIVATNLVGETNAAIIDEIVVEYTPTSCTASSPPPPGTTAAPLPETPQTQAQPDDRCKINCDFNSGACPQYTLGNGPSDGGKANAFVIGGEPYFRNRATGVVPSRDKHYFATYLKPKEKGYAEVEANMPKKTKIMFEEYKLTQDIKLRACCGNIDACYDTKNPTYKEDFHQWYQGSINCPAGTNKLIFYAENSGVNEGGVGIDNIQVFDADTEPPTKLQC